MSAYAEMRHRMSKNWRRLPIKKRIELRMRYLLKIVHEGWRPT